MAIAEISQPIQCSDGDNITYKHKVFSNTMIRDIPNLQETEDGCLVSIYRNHLNQYIKIRNSADDGIGWVLIDPITITGPLELSDILPQPVIEAVLPNQQPDEAVLPGQQPNGSVLPDQQANEAVLLNENAIAALPQATIKEALSGQRKIEALLPDQQGGVLPDVDGMVLQQHNTEFGLDQPDNDKVVSQHTEELQDPNGNAEELQDPTGNAERLQDPTGNAERLQDPTGNAERLQDPTGNAERLQDPTGNAERLQDPTGNAERLQDPPADEEVFALQVQITGYILPSTDASNSEENLSENPTPEPV